MVENNRNIFSQFWGQKSEIKLAGPLPLEKLGENLLHASLPACGGSQQPLAFLGWYGRHSNLCLRPLIATSSAVSVSSVSLIRTLVTGFKAHQDDLLVSKSLT